jgi:Trypsin
MRRRPRLVPIGALAILALSVPASAGAEAGPSAQPRIVGGSTASISTYPWQAAVVYSTAQLPSRNAQQREICGGELITSRIVMTAGHCVADTDPDCGPDAFSGNPPVCASVTDPGGDGTAKIDPNDLDVVLGRSTLTDTSQGAEVPLQGVKLGTSFNGDYQGDGVPRFDAAYLVLPGPSGQTPIKIAGTDEGALWGPGGAEEISGWGTVSEGGFPVNTLRAATVNVISDSTCSGDYGSDFDPATMVCAGFQSGGVDTCSGDSGGPLQAPLQGGGYRLVGITGWGFGCARPGSPGVYTRVAGPTMRSLIQSDVSSLGLPAENLFGSGGQPRTSTPSPSPSGATKSGAKSAKKCKRIHSRKKRRHCLKRARRKA